MEIKTKGIKYISPALDGSGYAKAARSNIKALHKFGVPLTLAPVSFESLRPDLGKDGDLINSLIARDIEYDTVIIHTTPEFWERHKEPGKLNIGMTIWETTALHPSWKDYINKNVDAIIVGCTWNVEVFRNSGVTLPIYVAPHPLMVMNKSAVSQYNIKGLDPSTFAFYFIAQFTERKDPISLLKAYWHAFQKDEDVALIFKTYRCDYSEVEKEAVRNTITRLRSVTIYDRYPKIYFIGDMLSEDDMLGLHSRGDCYVSLDRGEGFGMNPATAGAFGNPIIVTGFGGVTEYAKEDNSYLVDYNLEPVGGMPYSPWYRADQLWGNANTIHGAELMRHVFNNQKEAKEKGLKLQQYIKENLSEETIAYKILQAVDTSLDNKSK